MLRTGLLLLLAGLIGQGAGSQEETSTVQLRVVKYDGLANEVLKERGKVVLVDFWSTGCFPCRRNFPHVVELHKRLAARGLVVISVSMDSLEDNREKTLSAVRDFLKLQDASFTNLLLDE